MNVSATFAGNNVRIINVEGDGCMAYVTFIDSQGNLRVMQMGIGGGFDVNTSASSVIATNATGS